jgi:oxygen-dependent protoporphyrinogen oxidase
MWSFREGLGLLVDTLGQRLHHPPIVGVAPRRVAKVPATPADRPAWLITGDGRDQWQTDAVVLACPAPEQAALVSDLDCELANLISTIAYNRIAVVALGYRRDDVPADVDGFGFIAPQRLRRDILGVQYCSSIFPDRAPAGMVLLRAMCGGWHRPEIVDWDDDRLIRAVSGELSAAMGIQGPPRFHMIVRWNRAIPQYFLGHLDRIAAIEKRAANHAGLFLAGNAYHGVALNDCTAQARVVSERVSAYLQAADLR